MANYKHGVYVSETPTSLIPTVRVESAVPFVVGIAPVNTVDNPAVNEPKLVNSYAEGVGYFGFQKALPFNDAGDKKFDYDISEFLYANFNFYGIVPCYVVNVLDPAKHKKAIDATTLTLDTKEGTVTVKELGILKEGFTVSSEENVQYTLGTDYELSFDEDGYLVISSLPGESSGWKLGETIKVSGEKLDPSAVTKEDIIGGIDAATGKRRGLELINEIYPRYGVVPTLVLCPKFSKDPEVASIMAAKAVGVNGNFKAMALIDAPASASACQVYSDVPSWKKQNNVMLTQQIMCWPAVRNAETVYHSSVHLAGLIGTTDGNYGGVPYASPSNKVITITGMCLEDGTEVVFGNEEANYLNGQGIVTFLNFTKGWTLWGNRTCCYPGTTDPKDAFIPVRRMFQWVANTIVLTIWQKVDEPGNRRLIDSVVDSLNVWLNALTARQQLLGGRIEFREEDNSTTELMDGIYHFKVFMTPPSPAEDLEFDLEIDTDYYSTLFA